MDETEGDEEERLEEDEEAEEEDDEGGGLSRVRLPAFGFFGGILFCVGTCRFWGVG